MILYYLFFYARRRRPEDPGEGNSPGIPVFGLP